MKRAEPATAAPRTRKPKVSSATAAKPASTKRDAAALSQRERILHAAAEFFAEHGYDAASTAQLAQRCGVSKALLYHYYSSKDAILFDLLNGYTQRLLAIVAQVQHQHLAPRAKLHALLRALLDEYQTSRARHMVLLNNVNALAEPERKAVLDHERQAVQALADLLRASYPQEMTPENAKPLAMMIFGMINWTFTWLRPNGRISYSGFADAVISMIERGVVGAAAALPGAAATSSLQLSAKLRRIRPVRRPSHRNKRQ